MSQIIGNWITWVSALSMFLAVGGVLLINRRRIAGFPLFIVSNAMNFGLHCYAARSGVQGIWPLAVGDMVFFALAIDGLIRWSRISK